MVGHGSNRSDGPPKVTQPVSVWGWWTARLPWGRWGVVSTWIVLTVIEFLWWFAIGAVIGSFIGVVVERVPEGRSIQGRSLCACGRQLRAWENVPIVAWLVLRGRARCCGSEIPGWYTALEVKCGAITAAFMLVLPFAWPVRAAIAAGVLALVAWSGVDRRRRQLRNLDA